MNKLFDKNHLGHNFYEYKYSNGYMCSDEYKCIICDIRVICEFTNKKHFYYSEVDDTSYLTSGEILNCNEYQIKRLLE